MKVQVQMFARARDLAGGETIELSLAEGATIGALRRSLAAELPLLGPLLPHCLFAIDAEYASDETPILAGATIACIPPVSGG